MSTLGGNGFASGAVGAGLNETFQKELAKIKDPDVHQWASALVGATPAKIVGGDAQTGASTAVSGTKNNYLGEKYVNSAVNWIVDNGKDAIKSNINNLIETGMLSNPKDMEHDYRIIMTGTSLPIKFMGLASGYILDKHGNIYALIEGNGGFGVSTPIQITDGFGDFNALKDNRLYQCNRRMVFWWLWRSRDSNKHFGVFIWNSRFRSYRNNCNGNYPILR